MILIKERIKIEQCGELSCRDLWKFFWGVLEASLGRARAAFLKHSWGGMGRPCGALEARSCCVVWAFLWRPCSVFKAALAHS